MKDNPRPTPPPSRRRFLTQSALSVAAGSAFPLILPRSARGANDRITIGFIGVGGRANLLIDQLPDPGKILALADCDIQRCEDAAAKRHAKWDLYPDYRRILDR